MPRSKLTNKDRLELIRLHEFGWPPKKLAKEFSISYPAVLYYTRDIPQLPKDTILYKVCVNG